MQENMFKLGSKNLDAVDDFLGYSMYPNELPMCLGLSTLEAVSFLKKQTPFKDCVTYPVEYAVLQHKKKRNTFEDRDSLYTDLYKNMPAQIQGSISVVNCESGGRTISLLQLVKVKCKE